MKPTERRPDRPSGPQALFDIAKSYLANGHGTVSGLAEELHEEFPRLDLAEADVLAAEIIAVLQRGNHVLVDGTAVFPMRSGWVMR